MSGPDDHPAPELRDRRGEIVAGRYRLDVLLGRGGMGCVYRAQHLALDEPVVIKFIDPAFAQHPVARERFRREAKALIRLRHPGVVTMHEFGKDAGGLFLVMELLVGHTLAAELGNPAAPVPLPRIFAVFAQLAGVLDAIHAAGVVHRDVKPANVMMVYSGASAADRTERAVLMDFGLVRFDEAKDTTISTTGAVVGTPAYMSPEQCYGTPPGPPSDVYSMGMVLFEALAGHPPFPAESPAVLMSHHMFVAPAKLERLSSGAPVPAGLATLLEEMLAKKPEARPSAGEVLRRLEQIESGSDPQALGAVASERRLADAMKSRSERGLPIAKEAPDTEPTLLSGRDRATQPVVWLRGFAGERAGQLVASLAVNGVVAMAAETLASLGPPERRDALAAVVLPGGAQAPDLLRELRQTPEGAAVPVLVVDVPDAGELAELIRAGASDVALAMLGDDAVVAKLWRLIRRKR